MFYGCRELRTIKMPKHSIFSLEIADNMFSKCSNLREIDLTNFSTENLISIQFMFFECRALAKILISNKWDYIDYNESADTFYMCNELTNYDSDQLGGEFAKPAEQGGYLTLVQ